MQKWEEDIMSQIPVPLPPSKGKDDVEVLELTEEWLQSLPPTIPKWDSLDSTLANQAEDLPFERDQIFEEDDDDELTVIEEGNDEDNNSESNNNTKTRKGRKWRWREIAGGPEFTPVRKRPHPSMSARKIQITALNAPFCWDAVSTVSNMSAKSVRIRDVPGKPKWYSRDDLDLASPMWKLDESSRHHNRSQSPTHRWGTNLSEMKWVTTRLKKQVLTKIWEQNRASLRAHSPVERDETQKPELISSKSLKWKWD